MSERGEQALAGIVLAGGKGLRMGADKGRLLLPDGRPLLLAVVEAVSRVCDEVMVVTDAADRYADLSLTARRVADVVRERGPLGGLHAGLKGTDAPFALALAGDMPFPNPGLLSYMARLPRDYQALVPRFEGRWHPAHAVYARSCLPQVEALLTGEDVSLRALLSRLEVRELTEEEVRRQDPEGLALLSVNEPADLDRVRRLWQRRRG